LISLLPWQTAFAVQQQMSPHPDAASSIQIGLNAAPELRPPHHAFGGPGRRLGEVTLAVPLRIEGVPAGGMLWTEHVIARMKWPDGKTIERDLRGGPLGNQVISYPRDSYNREKNQVTTLELDYSLTLLMPKSTGALPALDGRRRMDGIGICTTHLNEEGGWIELHCTTMGNPPCMIRFLANPLTGQNDGRANGCYPVSDSPWFGVIAGDSLGYNGSDIHFRENLGESFRYPVNESQLKDSQVVIQTYEPAAHFTRHVVIPNFRLEDWSWD
jgi:hypothetical protein